MNQENPNSINAAGSAPMASNSSGLCGASARCVSLTENVSSKRLSLNPSLRPPFGRGRNPTNRTLGTIDVGVKPTFSASNLTLGGLLW